ncbi:MATE family efflux transporter, partial [Thermodesulfobacteriota bacterium]
GPEYIAALRIGHTVEGLSFFLAMGFSMSVATCIGQNLGAKQPQRAAQAAWISAGMVAGVLAVLSVLFYLFSYQIGSVFTQDLQAISACDEYLKILAYSQVFMGLELVFVGAFSGAGDTMPPMVLLVPLNLARIPAAFLLEGISGMGISGVWWAISGSSILKGILIMIWFSRGGWKKKRI